MTGYVISAGGERWQLPPPAAWELNYTLGEPCDSFWLRCPWDGGNGCSPALFTRFEGYEQGALVFSGVVDECEETLSPAGRRMELSGRGMAALLLDNEALPQDYERATLQDILRDHVTPYGIALAAPAALPAASRFSVAAGSSEWAVLRDFARYHGGTVPRFDRAGKLLLSPWSDGGALAVTDSTPVTELVCRDRRYGVLSEVLVRDRFSQRVQSVVNSAFRAAGGRSRRVVTMPGRGGWQEMRYSGQFQLDRSAAGLVQIELELPILFYARPGELVRLERSNFERNGTYRVAEVSVRADENGGFSRVTLADPQLVV